MTVNDQVDGDLVIDKEQQRNIAMMLEAIPHVAAWCYFGPGLPVPSNVHLACTSSACADYRASVAGEIYSAGFRLPVKPVSWLKKIPKPVVDSGLLE